MPKLNILVEVKEHGVLDLARVLTEQVHVGDEAEELQERAVDRSKAVRTARCKQRGDEVGARAEAADALGARPRRKQLGVDDGDVAVAHGRGVGRQQLVKPRAHQTSPLAQETVWLVVDAIVDAELVRGGMRHSWVNATAGEHSSERSSRAAAQQHP
eukprot:6183923-Pleurochrysis_carterae.AAC.1